MGRIRIVAGTLRGRRIDVPDLEGLRPTSERAREALFDILGPRVREAGVCDAYAGSGAVGLEALSRGARLVEFVESDPRAARGLRAVLESLGLAARARVHRGPARELLFRGAAGGPFDLVFADPPYESEERERLLAETRWAALLSGPEALLVVESDARRKVEKIPENGPLERFREARYGRTRFEFFRKRPIG